ncbi:hypothetical protein POM88_001736 [Heracleum sosnowskyi]|uniref:Uncharacterized protein n=1 Tax=Heracleum sosnowskyi TaxID=360622 RepID=A0AAD8JGF6_9APIA|nr:hypothetical protein POM88_001736 [Heracleum sosnowskyi]
MTCESTKCTSKLRMEYMKLCVDFIFLISWTVHPSVLCLYFSRTVATSPFKDQQIIRITNADYLFLYLHCDFRFLLCSSATPPSGSHMHNASKAFPVNGYEFSVDISEILKKFEQFKKFEIVEDFTDHHFVNDGTSTKKPSKNLLKRRKIYRS